MNDPTLNDIIHECLQWMSENPNITPEMIGLKVDHYEQTPYGMMGIITGKDVLNSNFYEIKSMDSVIERIN
jgi:hypothetical protein